MALVLEGTDVISRVRQIVGPSNPREATKDQIRGLVLSRFQDGKDGWRALELVTQGVDNFIHASDSQEASEREIALWFS
jgi:nucleoside diphosphate kinase